MAAGGTLIATQVLPPNQVTTPFDWMPIAYFGIPFWVVISGFLIICTLITIRFWWKKSSRLNSIRGWKESLQKMTQWDVQVWIISRVQKLTIECLIIKDNVLSYIDETNISMWHVNSAMGIIRVGGNPAVVISEDYDQNRDIMTELALCHGCEYANSHMDEMKKMLNEKYLKMVADKEIEKGSPNPADLCLHILDADTYDKTGRELMTNLWPEGVRKPAYEIFNPNKFRKYFPRGCGAMFFGGELYRDSSKLNTNETPENWVSKNAILGAALIIALVAIIVAFYLPIQSMIYTVVH